MLIENTTFNESLGILRKLNLLISNDNGFAHLANALGIKTITLFGPTNMDFCAPYNNKLTINLRKASFVPWFRNDIKVTNLPKYAESGMEKIQVEDVIKSAETLLKK